MATRLKNEAPTTIDQSQLRAQNSLHPRRSWERKDSGATSRAGPMWRAASEATLRT